ncbi:MAG: ZIP family metal transporter, partial [Candidatus Poseidoniia archaeon]|nr:ZIP family metal transporter [Candidatus Poseidoniia archaeon]
MFLSWFYTIGPLYQALLATLFTWFVTAAGAALVFFTKTMNRKLLDAMLGFGAGVMIAASFWSLLAPSIEYAAMQGMIPWLPAAIGFLSGGITLRVIDKF